MAVLEPPRDCVVFPTDVQGGGGRLATVEGKARAAPPRSPNGPTLLFKARRPAGKQILSHTS